MSGRWQITRQASRWLTWVAWCDLLLMVTLWLALQYAQEQWWPLAMLLFAPRWLAALPTAFLVPLAVWRRRRALLPLMLAGGVVAGPLMGFNLPLKETVGSGSHHIRVLSYNILGGWYNAEEFAALLRESAIDVAALQECPDALRLPVPAGWQVVRHGGLAVLSRYPIVSYNATELQQKTELWPETHLLQAVIQTPKGAVDVCSLHLPSPRFGLQALLDRRTLVRPSRRQLFDQQIAGRWFVAGNLADTIGTLKPPVILAGDFNTPVESNLYKRYWNGYANAFSATGWGYGFTQRVSVGGLSFGVRIDHILVGKGLKPLSCRVGRDIGSDHLPLIADIGW